MNKDDYDSWDFFTDLWGYSKHGFSRPMSSARYNYPWFDDLVRADMQAELPRLIDDVQKGRNRNG